MAKRESKGQKVKTFKHHTPDDRGDHAAEIVTVYLQVENPLGFVAWLPPHIGASLPALDCYAGNVYFKGGGKVAFDDRTSTIRSSSIDSLKEGYAQACRQYAKMLTEQAAVPVLHVEFKANLPYDTERGNQGDFQFDGGRAVGAHDMHFAPTPAIALVVRKLWRQPSKTILYRKRLDRGHGDRPDREVLDYDSASLGHWGKDDPKVVAKWEASIIPWSQEREDFLMGIVANIQRLGWLMKDFLKDFEGNITFAIENGSKSLMLAPPKDAQPEEPKPARVRERTRSA